MITVVMIIITNLAFGMAWTCIFVRAFRHLQRQRMIFQKKMAEVDRRQAEIKSKAELTKRMLDKNLFNARFEAIVGEGGDEQIRRLETQRLVLTEELDAEIQELNELKAYIGEIHFGDE